MLSIADKRFIDKSIERSMMRYPRGMDPKDPDESMMYEWAGEQLFEEVWEDELYDIASEIFTESEDPEEEFNALPEEEQRKHVSAYTDKKLDKMSYSDLYEYVDDRGYFEVDYDPHEKDEWDA